MVFTSDQKLSWCCLSPQCAEFNTAVPMKSYIAACSVQSVMAKLYLKSWRICLLICSTDKESCWHQALLYAESDENETHRRNSETFWPAVEVEKAHRAGKPGGGGERPGPIIAKLPRRKDRGAIVQRVKLPKGTTIFINEDCTDAVKRKRREPMPRLRAATERGDAAFLRQEQLIVHPRGSALNPRT